MLWRPQKQNKYIIGRVVFGKWLLTFFWRVTNGGTSDGGWWMVGLDYLADSVETKWRMWEFFLFFLFFFASVEEEELIDENNT